MKRFSTMVAASALLGVAGCASNGDDTAVAAAPRSAAPQTQSAPQMSTPAPATSGYTDAQIESFVRAREQINQISPGATPEQQAANQQRISQILQENGITPDQYNAILSAARTDQALNNRISVAAVGDSFSDAQLRSFIAASIEIQPINATLASGTDAERAAAAEQIRGILQRNNLDIETYNGIAAQIRSNPELQTRLNTLAQTAPSGME
ncbi:MAG: DUF4168 domain-containing protein [Hyphomonadaceae bacterium]|nr:DUF4168 domain-containing protein [Hyphomonadaceae bacterium]